MFKGEIDMGNYTKTQPHSCFIDILPQSHGVKRNYSLILKSGGGADINVPTMKLQSHFLNSLVQIRKASSILPVAHCTPDLQLCLSWTLCASGTRLQLVQTDRILRKHAGSSCLSKNQIPKFISTSGVSIFLTRTWMLLKRYE